MTIRILEDHVVNQIAAGEVVERPASVVKELLENALDAGARTIRVSLRGGGRSLVRVTDDGCGMDRADALMCLERHATSKLRDTTDLERVQTLGFRGEAIPSVAAVSRFQLVTRPHDADVGTRVKVDGGQLEDVSDVGCAPGTEIDVRALFFNLPARRKFLRTLDTELSHSVEAVIREVLVRPSVDVTVTHEDREVLRAPPARDLAARAVDILGSWATELRPVAFADGPYQLEGLLGPAALHRSTPGAGMYLYVNGRYVRDAVLRRAVQEAYEDRVPKGRFPVVVLDFRIEPSLVDVNVHPSKIEVRFHDPRGVGEFLAGGLREALGRSGILRPVEQGPRLPFGDPDAPVLPLGRAGSAPLFEAPASRALPYTAPAGALRRADPSERLFGAPASQGVPAHPDDDPRLQPPAPAPDDGGLPVGPSLAAEPAYGEAPDGPAGAGRFRDLRVVGHLGGAWIVAEKDTDLILVDLQVARTTVLLDRLLKDRAGTLGATQRLLTPARVALPRARISSLTLASAALVELHVDAEEFGPGELAVRGLPPLLRGVAPDALLADLADALVGYSPGADPIPALRVVARHAATRANDGLTDLALRTLLASLDEVAPAARGSRPSHVHVTAAEIVRWFGRRR